MKIPYTTAVLGGEIKIHTLYGDVVCKIKPGTQSGAKIRLKGKGVAAMNNPAVHGDEYAQVQIEVPTHLSQTAKRKITGICTGMQLNVRLLFAGQPVNSNM